MNRLLCDDSIAFDRSIRFLPKVSYKVCLSLMLVLLSIVAEVVLRFLVDVSSEKCLFDVEEEET